MDKHYYLVGEKVEDVKSLIGKKLAGARTTFSKWEDNITFLPGYNTTLYGSPGSGKSFIILYILVNLSKRDNSLCMLYTPEMGTTDQIIAQLLWIYTGKSINVVGNGVETLSGKEFDDALRWLNNHFIILDFDVVPTIHNIYEQYDLFTANYKKKIDYVLIDNLSDIREEFVQGRQDLGIESMYVAIRNYDKKRESHSFLVSHSSSQGQPEKSNGILYYGKPHVAQCRGGLAISRKGYQIISVWRQIFGLQDEEGNPYPENGVELTVVKSKPHGSGTKNFAGKLIFNYRTSQFREQ